LDDALVRPRTAGTEPPGYAAPYLL
jgi:hypothetical protein